MSNRRVSQGSVQHGLRTQLLKGALPQVRHLFLTIVSLPQEKKGTAKEKGERTKGGK